MNYFFVLHAVAVSLLLLSWSPRATAAAPAPNSVLLANVFSADVDVTLYLVSEKYDGVRAIWDGKVMRFRSGNVVNAPAWFLAKLPTTPLDGELWMGRQKFELLSGAVRKRVPVDAEWQKITYMIFEQPDGVGTFSERIARLQQVVAAVNWPQLKVTEQMRVPDRVTLNLLLNDVVKGGGEGLMLHRADAPYVTGRSNALLKLKKHLDTEAVVVAHIPGQGKYRGMLGALEVKTPAGVVFKIGTGFTDHARKNPPPVGSTITYTYRDFTKNGVPRFASFMRVRDDP